MSTIPKNDKDRGTEKHALSSDQLLVLQLVNGVARSQGVRVFLVGGVVRDLLLGFSIQDKDLDLIVEGDAARFAEACLPMLGGHVKRFERFFTAKIIGPTKVPKVAEIDFASTREEVYDHPGALPTVSRISSIERDLRRRDFSINAIALPIEVVLADASVSALAAGVIDPFSGLADLQDRVVRVLHERSFIDDPTRVFRAARYATRLGGAPDPETRRRIEEAAQENAFGTVSVFRLMMEMKKVASERRWLSAARLLDSWGVWGRLWACDGRALSEALRRWAGWQTAWYETTPGEDCFECINPIAVQRALLALVAPQDIENREAWAKSLQLSRAERLKLMEGVEWLARAEEQGGRNVQPEGACPALLLLGTLEPGAEQHQAIAQGLRPALLNSKE
jgi:tRNA nucleotidyltransferase/poly(A) polymerase